MPAGNSIPLNHINMSNKRFRRGKNSQHEIINPQLLFNKPCKLPKVLWLISSARRYPTIKANPAPT